MDTLVIAFTVASAVLWCGILLAPWRPWRAAPVLDADPAVEHGPLSSVAALIPARNEALVLKQSLSALNAQGAGLRVIVVDDQSADATAAIAQAAGATVISGRPVPSDWSGKLWALEQGRRHASAEYLLLLDADIALAPGILNTLLAKMRRERIVFASLVPELRLDRFWEKLLMPAFIYFFRLLYPFHLSNLPDSRIAAASGGCILLEIRALEAIGGFGALKNTLIDDCGLANRIKSQGHRTWIGLTHSARSLRAYTRLAQIWVMVERTAFTQLNYSMGCLLACTAIMAIAFWIPVAGAFHPSVIAQGSALAAFVAMSLSYLPTLRFYGRSVGWVFAMPVIGTLYLAMTWTSAMRYARGERARWKDRVYETKPRHAP